MEPGREEQELVFEFSQLRISVRVTVEPIAGASSTGPVGVVSVAAGASSTPPPEPVIVDPYLISVDLENQVLQADRAERLAELLPFLRAWETRLRGQDPVWTPRARLARAFRAGVAACRRLEGQFVEASSPVIPFQNSIYIILRSPSLPAGGWTTNYSLFICNCGRNATSDFDRTTVCQSLATRVEADAFLLGARRPWPSQLQ